MHHLKKCYQVWCVISLTFWMNTAFSQGITRYQYWFDAATSRTVRTATPVSDVMTDSVAVSSLGVGLHQLNIRFGNPTQWTSVTTNYFYKIGGQAMSGISGYEYWFDDDLSQSQLRSLTPLAADGMVLDSVNVSNLSVGLHRFNMRFRAADRWSSPTTTYFYKTNTSALSGLRGYEYWFDDNLGQSQSRTLSNPTADGIVLDSVNVSNLSVGLHRFNMRFRGADRWTSLTTTYFYKINTGALSGLRGYEYWFDDNLGQRQSRTLSNPAADGIILDSVNVSSLNIGLHRFNMRFRGADRWTSATTTYFYKINAQSLSGASLLEYWFGLDYANRRIKPIAENAEGLILDSTEVRHLCRNNYLFHYRVKTVAGWTSILRHSFLKNAYATNEAKADFAYYIGNTREAIAYFNSSSANYTWHRWDFGDGTKDSISVSPSHRYTRAGNYNVCLAVKNQLVGTCGEDLICKQVIIKGLKTITPNQVANQGSILVQLNGFGITSNSRIELYKENRILTPQRALWIDDSQWKLYFQFNNAPTGLWSVRAIQGIDTLRLSDTFRIQATESFQPQIAIAGPSELLRGREATYTVTISNPSNVLAIGVPVLIHANPLKIMRLTDSLVQHFDGIRPTFRDSMAERSGFYKTTHPETNQPIQFGLFTIPYIPPHSSETIRFNMKSNEDSPADLSIYARPSLFDTTDLPALGIRFTNDPCNPTNNECINSLASAVTTALGFVPGAIGSAAGWFGLYCSIHNAVQQPNAPNTVKAFFDSVLGLGLPTAQEGVDAHGVTSPKSALAKGALKGALTAMGHGLNLFNLSNDLQNVRNKCKPKPPIRAGMNIPTRNSLDPNLKVGLAGINDFNATNGNEILPYRIMFENADTATAPASEVTVLDTLDRSKFDLNTFEFVDFNFGDSTYRIPPASKSFVKQIDLRPRKNILLRVTGEIDSLGIIKCYYASLDPATMDITQIVDDGFLPPNRRKPEGEGFFSYQIKPRSGLTHLTQIRNKASIVFDYNDPIPTPYWINTIDKVPPQSRVLSATAIQSDTILKIQWGGTDSEAGILDYTIFVSENNAPFMQWLSNISVDTARFTARRGRTYAFYAIARDYVGNVEAKNPIAEVFTGRVAIDENPTITAWLGQNRPNPVTETTQIDFYLAEYSQKVRLDVYNVAGIKVKTVLDNAFPAGQHTINVDLKGFASGIYFYRMETDTFSQTKRMYLLGH